MMHDEQDNKIATATSEGSVEDEDLVKCDKINKIVPSIYYNVGQLRHLEPDFAQNTALQHTEVALLGLQILAHTTDNKADYISQYRELLILALNYLSDFITHLPDLGTMNADKAQRLLYISNELAQCQRDLLAIIDEEP